LLFPCSTRKNGSGFASSEKLAMQSALNLILGTLKSLILPVLKLSLCDAIVSFCGSTIVFSYELSNERFSINRTLTIGDIYFVQEDRVAIPPLVSMPLAGLRSGPSIVPTDRSSTWKNDDMSLSFVPCFDDKGGRFLVSSLWGGFSAIYESLL